MNSSPRTRLAVLGTVADLHREPIAFDLANLRELVASLAPDLLCAEVTPPAWEGGALSAAAVEVREALAPVVAASEVVLIPVAADARQFDDFRPVAGWRRRAARALGRLLRWSQRRAGRAEAVNGPWYGAVCHTVCAATERLWSAPDRAAWEAQTQALADNVLRAVQRDPGRRVLVVVQCQRLHQLLPRLAAHRDVLEIVNYQVL
jgi:hypothetical protein